MKRIIDTITRIAGAIMLLLTMFSFALYFVAKVECALANPAISKGVVTAKSFDNGHYYYSEYTVGRYTLKKKCGDGKTHYNIEVTDEKGRTDWWEVSRDFYHDIEIGKTVTKEEVEKDEYDSSL